MVWWTSFKINFNKLYLLLHANAIEYYWVNEGGADVQLCSLEYVSLLKWDVDLEGGYVCSIFKQRNLLNQYDINASNELSGAAQLNGKRQKHYKSFWTQWRYDLIDQSIAAFH